MPHVGSGTGVGFRYGGDGEAAAPPVPDTTLLLLDSGALFLLDSGEFLILD